MKIKGKISIASKLAKLLIVAFCVWVVITLIFIVIVSIPIFVDNWMYPEWHMNLMKQGIRLDLLFGAFTGIIALFTFLFDYLSNRLQKEKV
ncbi:MAG: hypothetical protein IMZ52_09630 [Actinobacteria bacterium]|nr:hypothetical protein [Actinomycetota bacterium]